MVNLLQSLAITGFRAKSGFFGSDFRFGSLESLDTTRFEMLKDLKEMLKA